MPEKLFYSRFELSINIFDLFFDIIVVSFFLWWCRWKKILIFFIDKKNLKDMQKSLYSIPFIHPMPVYLYGFISLQ